MTALDPQAALAVQLAVRLRPATAEDLPKLEWYGQYKHFRNIFLRTFHEQKAGNRLMLLADVNNFPVGQLFIHFKDRPYGRVRAYFYSFRVMEMFRSQGIGTRMLQEAEAIALDRGIRRATIAAAKTNMQARRLYERLGYRVFRDDAGYWHYVDHLGQTREMNEPCWILEKKLIPR